jgi:hypothetical protein
MPRLSRFTNALRRSAVLGAVTLVLAAAGCFKEKVTFTVYPDGSGKIAFEETILKDVAGFALMGAKTDQERKAAAEHEILKSLAKYEGVCAWTDVKSELTAKGEITGSAVGYFEDLSKVREVSESTNNGWTWTKNADGGFTFELASGKSGADGKDKVDEYLKAPSKDDAGMEEMLYPILAGLRLEVGVVMPGAVTAAESPLVKDGRNATFTIEGKTAVPAIKALKAKGQELRKQIDAGSMTQDAARAELHKDYEKLDSGFKVTCAPSDVSAECAANRAALEAAKKAYEGSATAEAVKKAKWHPKVTSNPPLAASYAGTFTRVGDQKVFHVTDDGKTVKGVLEGAPDAYTFELARSADGTELVGTAHVKDKESGKTLDLAWRLHVESEHWLGGDMEYVDLDPATSAVLSRGQEKQELVFHPATETN